MLIKNTIRKNKKKKVNKAGRKKNGCGFVDKIIDKLPFELHLPSYQFAGPGTRLSERLARGDKGINKLDEFCREHDIAYATHKDSSERRKADEKLGDEALKRVFSKDANFGERAASLLVSAAMKAKTGLSKIGLGVSKLNCRKKSKKTSKEMAFTTLVKNARDGIRKSKATNVDMAVKAALRSAKKSARGKNIKIPRILKVPSFTGGVLPILPILAGLGAIGSIVGSTAQVVKTAKAIKAAEEQLKENKRHNKAMEMKIGNGLYLRPHKKGNGLYLRPASKNW